MKNLVICSIVSLFLKAIGFQGSYVPNTNDLNAIGNICDFRKDARYGYGFAISHDQNILTCWHVALCDTVAARIFDTLSVIGPELKLKAKDTLRFQRLNNRRMDTLSLVIAIPTLDIAIYKLINQKIDCYLDIGGLGSDVPGDTISFPVWRNLKNIASNFGNIFVLKRPILSIDSSESDGYYLKVLHARSTAHFGTSGSPVFDTRGKVIAMIGRGGDEQVRQNGDTTAILDAYVLKPVIDSILKLIPNETPKPTKQ